jgi:hypothetical protein
MKKSSYAILVAVIVLLGICSAGCKSNPLIEPADAFCNTVGTEYLKYVEADPNLDESGKQARRTNVAAFKALIEEAKK